MTLLKIVGPSLILLGIITTAILFYQFFTVELYEDLPPIGLLFLSLPTIFLGFILTGVGFSKEIRQNNLKYIREQSQAVGEGLKEGFSDGKFCTNCGELVPKSAKFCAECGSKQA